MNGANVLRFIYDDLAIATSERRQDLRLATEHLEGPVSAERVSISTDFAETLNGGYSIFNRNSRVMKSRIDIHDARLVLQLNLTYLLGKLGRFLRPKLKVLV